MAEQIYEANRLRFFADLKTAFALEEQGIVTPEAALEAWRKSIKTWHNGLEVSNKDHERFSNNSKEPSWGAWGEQTLQRKRTHNKSKLGREWRSSSTGGAR
jgi:hypothetical protein